MPECSECVFPESSESCAWAASRDLGFEYLLSPSASVWSAPSTAFPAFRFAVSNAFVRASRRAAPSGVAASEGAAVSAARSSISAGSITSGMPAASSSIRRGALFDASTNGSPRHKRHELIAASRRRSCKSAITAAAVSSIERRVTSISGQLLRAQSFFESAISSVTD